jgi:fermentation-respiration switch protein FrsA (DUF1100 family)
MTSRIVRVALMGGVVALGAALASRVAAQGAAGAVLPERLQPGTRAEVERLADSLRIAGLPWEALYAKSAEGVLKGAEDARILHAVRSLARELTGARTALGASVTPAEIVAGASALHAGVPPDDLRRLARTRASRSGESPLALPLTVLADLVARRVPPDVATASVEALLSRGAPDEQFAVLRADVQRDILSGTTPAAAARRRALIQSSGPPEH